jgi:hypothetical protein
MPYDPTFQAYVMPVLQTAFEAAFDSIFDGRVYHQVQNDNIFPLLIYQSGDRGGKRNDYIGQNGWNGIVVFRSLDLDGKAAWDNLISVASALSSLTAVGYSFTYIVENPQEFPVEHTSFGDIHTAGLIVNLYIHKN